MLLEDFEIRMVDKKVSVQKSFNEFLYNCETTPEYTYE